MTTDYPKLKVLSGEKRGKVFQLKKKKHSCGRTEDNDITLDDTSISTHHCFFRMDNFGYTVIDNESTNGTLVNNMTVKIKDLKHEDIVTIGNIELLYDSGELKNSKIKTSSSKIPIKLIDKNESIPLNEMKNFSPFADKKDSKSKLMRKITLFLCVALVITAIFLLMRILLVTL